MKHYKVLALAINAPNGDTLLKGNIYPEIRFAHLKESLDQKAIEEVIEYEHIVTDEDLVKNPELAQQSVLAGEEIKIPYSQLDAE